MKSAHPTRSGRDGHEVTRLKKLEENSSARLEEAVRLSVSVSSVIMQSKCKPPRDAVKKEAVRLGRRRHIIMTKQSLAENQPGIKTHVRIETREEKKGNQSKRSLRVDETPSHALDAVSLHDDSSCVYRSCLEPGVARHWVRFEDWPGPRCQASTEGQGITDGRPRLM